MSIARIFAGLLLVALRVLVVVVLCWALFKSGWGWPAKLAVALVVGPPAIWGIVTLPRVARYIATGHRTDVYHGR